MTSSIQGRCYDWMAYLRRDTRPTIFKNQNFKFCFYTRKKRSNCSHFIGCTPFEQHGVLHESRRWKLMQWNIALLESSM